MITIKLQVPMDKGVRDALEKRAEQLGFDSAQAYIRFWAKAEADGRRVNLNDDTWGKPSNEAAQRLNRWAKQAERDNNTGKLKAYTSADDFMEDLDA